MDTFEYQYLPDSVAKDFREALTCFSHSCLNAAAAMCRRTIQSAATILGTTGKSKVESQILEIKEKAGIDDATFESLRQVMLTGHDGAHPHLPEVTQDRAVLMVALMKDVLTQLFVRERKIKQAMELRQQAIADKSKV